MTNEEKTLLLQDLSARLPYGVSIAKGNIIYPMSGINAALGYVELAISERISIEKARPYLRPMSSMTAKEQQEFVLFHCVKSCPIVITNMLTLDNESKMFNWLNAHYFDYRGLISRGLGIEAPEGMYNV